MRKSKNWMIAVVTVGVVSLALASCSSKSTPSNVSPTVNLTGAGSTFAIPLLDSCKAGFTTATGKSYTYTGGGSGAGRSASDIGINDFNFSDTPHTAATRRATVIHVPVIAAPIAVMYRVDSLTNLNFSPATVAAIFAGKITKWNDQAIVSDNKGITLPSQGIHVIYRSDASGTSGNFTNFLHGMAPTIWTIAGNNDFKTSFPGNINSIGNLGRVVGANGSSGVAVLAGKTPYSITYAEMSYAKASGLSVAKIKNAAGNFQAPDSAGTSAFLGAATINANGYLTFNYNTTLAGAYPLGIVSYALVDTKAKNAAAVKSLLTYLLDPKCPSANPSLGYATITGSLLALDKAQIAKIG